MKYNVITFKMNSSFIDLVGFIALFPPSL